MANTYTQISIHLIFAVRNRESIIKPTFRDSLYKYIYGILHNQKQKLLAINGMTDHIHIFFGMNPDTHLSDLVRDIKRDSSKFINENKLCKFKFYWQEGYGGFS
jgi:putative transposase